MVVSVDDQLLRHYLRLHVGPCIQSGPSLTQASDESSATGCRMVNVLRGRVVW